MRPWTTIALLPLAACGGSWSDADLEFVRPVPTRQDLTLNPPASSTTQQQGLGPSSVYTSVVQMTNGIDAFIDWITGALDYVRSIPPTSRPADNQRIWGPWNDSQHPGYKVRVTITRDDSRTPVVYDYALEQLPPGGQWTTVMDGLFQGDRATDGSGAINLHVAVARSIGTADPSDPNTLEVDVSYNLTNGDATVVAHIQAQSGTGVAQAAIAYDVKADGGGQIAFSVDGIQVPNSNPPQTSSVQVKAQWLANKSGRSDDVFSGGNLGSAVAQYAECWDATFNQVFATLQVTCNGAPSCCAGAGSCAQSQGDPAQCSIPPGP